MRQRINRLLSNRLPAVLWTTLIFILMVIPGKMLPSEEQTFVPNLDKLVHAILFGGFVFLWAFYLAAKTTTNSASHKITYSFKTVFRLFVIASLYGITMEYVQKYLIPNRDYDAYDIAADIAGAAIGFIIVRMTFK